MADTTVTYDKNGKKIITYGPSSASEIIGNIAQLVAPKAITQRKQKLQQEEDEGMGNRAKIADAMSNQ